MYWSEIQFTSWTLYTADYSLNLIRRYEKEGQEAGWQFEWKTVSQKQKPRVACSSGNAFNQRTNESRHCTMPTTWISFKVDNMSHVYQSITLNGMLLQSAFNGISEIWSNTVIVSTEIERERVRE